MSKTDKQALAEACADGRKESSTPERHRWNVAIAVAHTLGRGL